MSVPAMPVYLLQHPHLLFWLSPCFARRFSHEAGCSFEALSGFFNFLERNPCDGILASGSKTDCLSPTPIKIPTGDIWRLNTSEHRRPNPWLVSFWDDGDGTCERNTAWDSSEGRGRKVGSFGRTGGPLRGTGFPVG